MWSIVGTHSINFTLYKSWIVFSISHCIYNNSEQLKQHSKITLSNYYEDFGEHHYSIKEIKLELQMPALFDKKIMISLSDSDHDVK